MAMQQYCLRWNNHQPNFISVFSSLLNSESLVDVTLAAEGRHLQAHKVVLSACSSYFQSLFTINPCQHPIVILKDVKFADLKVIVDFMYYGEVNVSQDQLPHILKTAEMLKIKGLAEIPVEQSVTKASTTNNTVEKTELLTSGETTWSSDGTVARQPSPASPCPPLSPTGKRKRLRKLSTESGSGSAERAADDHTSEMTMTSSSMLANVIKTDTSPTYATEVMVKKQTSSETEVHRTSSHSTGTETDIPQHHVTLQVPQEVNPSPSLESSSSMEVGGPSTSTPHQTLTEKLMTTHTQYAPRNAPIVMGTKRGRILMRQPRIKKECDQSCENDPLSPQYLTVPPVKVERQCSEPLPSTSSPPSNLLTVPAVLMKQHSHPLLPSQVQPHISSPLHIQIVPTHGGETPERVASPSADPLVLPHDSGTRSDLGIPTSSIRVRTEELRRSASSPQTGTRSSHCPVIRSGPALGCNYCWNTVDTHGRILRRKTKYHCPECQTNLCIVPCFQEYHERHANTSQTDPIALTTSVMKVFPKTTSM